MLIINIGLSTSIINNSIRDGKLNLNSIFSIAQESDISAIEIVLNEMGGTVDILENDNIYKYNVKNFEIFFHIYDLELINSKYNIKYIKKIFNLCLIYDVHRLIIHPGFISLEKISINIWNFFKIAQQFDIMIIIENGYKKDELFQLIEEQINCIRKIRENGALNVFAAYDVWRGFKVHHNTEKIVYSIQRLLDFDLLKHLHFSDGKEPLNISVALGEGEIDIDMILGALNDFDGYLVLEVDSPEDAIKSVNYLKNKNIL